MQDHDAALVGASTARDPPLRAGVFNPPARAQLWCTAGNRIAVRFAYEWHDDAGNWFRSYGNENWEFDERGLMAHRHASINDLAITEADRLFRWPQGRRPDDHPGLSELGL
jgi:nuclear transport factor 2 (NTF2) superfamily protein